MKTPSAIAPVILITGAAKRIGAALAEHFHALGYRVAIHCHHSTDQAEKLAEQFNQLKPESAAVYSVDLADIAALEVMAKKVCEDFGRIDVLINNASSFYPTSLGTVSEQHWDDLFASNLKAPFFLAQALAPSLADSGGCIINIADIHADRPLKEHTVYCCAKAGNVMLTKSLARELGPVVRVNGVAPGAIAWPEANELSQDAKSAIVERTALKRSGCFEDIVETVDFLVRRAPYITGQIIPVDGGRTLAN